MKGRVAFPSVLLTLCPRGLVHCDDTVYAQTSPSLSLFLLFPGCYRKDVFSKSLWKSNVIQA